MGLFFATLAVVKNRTEGLPSTSTYYLKGEYPLYVRFLDRKGQEKVRRSRFRRRWFRLRGLLFLAVRI